MNSDSKKKALKVALIGFGGIAQMHRYAYWHHTCAGVPVALVAACDADPESFRRSVAINLEIPDDLPPAPPFAEYTDWRKMIEEQKPDLVDICLPTRFHEPVTVEALRMGCSVLCEKPMALDYAAGKRMLEAAHKASGKLMIAQCVRFYPQYELLYQAVKDKRYGAVKSVRFSRVTPLPSWGNQNWRAADPRIGSCLTELNVHDIDVMQYIFGSPEKLSCRLESRVTPYDRAESRFFYDDLEIDVHSEWLDDSGLFRMSYTAEFSEGTLCFDGTEIFFTDSAGNRRTLPVSPLDGFVEETGYFIRLLTSGEPNRRNPPEQSAHTLYLLEKCFESAEKNAETLDLEVLREF